MEAFRSKLHSGAQILLTPLVALFVAIRITPNQVSALGVLINIAAAMLIIDGALLWAGIIYVVAGILDLADGALARKTGADSPFGAFLDSTLDRVSEGVVLAAIGYHFAASANPTGAAMVVLALLGSLLVSYTRARAEALGCECKGGFAARLERLLLLSAALILGFLEPAIYLLAAATMFTVCQRVWNTANQLANKPGD